MSNFNDLLFAVHAEIWEAGTAPRGELYKLLFDLADAAMPEGVSRLPGSAMVPGPHLAAQDEYGEVARDVIWLEAGRLARARARAQRFAAY